jgi:hypothetical protein
MDQIWFVKNKLIHEAITHVLLNALKCMKNITQHHLVDWHNSNLADWDPSPLGSFKVNFNVVIRHTFAVAAPVFLDHSEKFLTVNTLKLPPMDALMGEAQCNLIGLQNGCFNGLFLPDHCRRLYLYYSGFEGSFACLILDLCTSNF